MIFEFDLDKTVASALEAALAPDRIAEKITAQVTKSVDEVITEHFRTYSDFGKAVKKALAEVVPHEISMGGQSHFRDSISKIVAARLTAYQDDAMIKQLDKTMEELLQKQPESVTLSSLIERMVKAWSGEFDRDGSDRPTIIVEKSSGVLSEFFHIYLDPKGSQSMHSCRCRIDLNKDSVYGLKLDGTELRKHLFVGAMYDFERYLFWLHTGGTKIIIDEMNFDDVYYSEEHED